MAGSPAAQPAAATPAAGQTATPPANSPAAPASSPPAASPAAASPPAASSPAAGQTVSPEASTAIEPAHLEADDATTDDGSSLHDSISNYTASLSSSVVDYPTEYGRRYHAFRQGAYSFPNDEAEMERLDMAHSLILKSLHNRLYLAPLEQEKVHRILDVGTGTGIWAVEMGDVFPNAEVIGNDLSAIQTTWVPPNVKFEVDDVESPWIGDKKYDFIHVRYMLVSIADWPKLVKNIFDNLNPGGWVEFNEMDGLYYADDDTYPETCALRKWNTEYIQACEDMGRTARPGPKIEGWVREVGFENVHHEKFKIPIGPWAKDPHFKELGLINVVQLMDGLEGFTFKLFCGFLGRTREEVLVMLAQVRKELKEVTSHAIYDQHVIYAQKPLTAEEET